jgi:hypothetical protein
VPDLVRTPGYPLFLAMTSFAGLPAAAVANVILSVFSVILVWKLGRAAFGDGRIALGAAWIFAFEPVSIALSVVLLSETLFLTLFLLSLERLAEFLRGRRLPVLAAAGVWLSAATFVRPVTYYLPIALALGLFLVLARLPNSSSQRPGYLAGASDLLWKAPAVLLISVLPWMAAWQIRNRVETGYGGFSSLEDVDLYFFSADAVIARLEHRGWHEVQEELGYTGFKNRSGQSYLYQNYLVRHPEQSGWNQGQRLSFMHAEALRVIRAHYVIYLRLCFVDTFKTVADPGTWYFDNLLVPHREASSRPADLFMDVGLARWGREFTQAHPWEAAEKAVFAVVLLGVYLLAARGIFRGGPWNACLWLLMGVSFYFFAVSAVAAGPAADARYRLPVMPIVCIFAAAGVLHRARASEL